MRSGAARGSDHDRMKVRCAPRSERLLCVGDEAGPRLSTCKASKFSLGPTVRREGPRLVVGTAAWPTVCSSCLIMPWTGQAPPFFPVHGSSEERDELSAIIPKKLYLTNYRGAESLDALKRVKCTHVAAIGAEFMDNSENHAASTLKLKFWNKDITDDEEERSSMASSLQGIAIYAREKAAL